MIDVIFVIAVTVLVWQLIRLCLGPLFESAPQLLLHQNLRLTGLKQEMLKQPIHTNPGDKVYTEWGHIELSHEAEIEWTWDRVLRAETSDGVRWFLSDGKRVVPLEQSDAPTK